MSWWPWASKETPEVGSEHYPLSALTTTKHTQYDNQPTSASHEVQLDWFAENILEKIHKGFGPVEVTSAFRTPEVNTAADGSDTSRHMHGDAADLKPLHGKTSEELATWLYYSGLPLDQVILYHPAKGGHVHVGVWTGKTFQRRDFRYQPETGSTVKWSPHGTGAAAVLLHPIAFAAGLKRQWPALLGLWGGMVLLVGVVGYFLFFRPRRRR